MSVLTLKHNKKEYTSNPFDFKDMCLINEKHNDENIKGPLLTCAEAVEHMFEGTEGEKVLNEITPGARAQLCVDAWNMYLDELARKNG